MVNFNLIWIMKNAVLKQNFAQLRVGDDHQKLKCAIAEIAVGDNQLTRVEKFWQRDAPVEHLDKESA